MDHARDQDYKHGRREKTPKSCDAVRRNPFKSSPTALACDTSGESINFSEDDEQASLYDGLANIIPSSKKRPIQEESATSLKKRDIHTSNGGASEVSGRTERMPQESLKDRIIRQRGKQTV